MVEKEISWPGGAADLKKSGRKLENREGFEAEEFGNGKHAYQAQLKLEISYNGL